MQIFMTHQSYAKTAAILDMPRLGKQRVECLQILNNLIGVKECYPHHPVQNMWRGYEYALCVYAMQTCDEFKKRGGADQMYHRFAEAAMALGTSMEHPPWYRDHDVYRSHRSNLIRKDPTRYVPLFPRTPRLWPYLWPLVSEDGSYVLRVSEADRKRIANGERRPLPDDLAARVVNY